MPEVDDAAFLLPNTGKVDGRQRASFLHLLEVYVNNFIQMAQTSNRATLRHLSIALIYGVHSMFPYSEVTGHMGEDPVSCSRIRR